MSCYREPLFLPCRRRSAALLLALMVSLPCSLVGEPARSHRKPTFRESIDAEIVAVDVVVSDELGEPIIGLAPADFALLVDGEPTEIGDFLAVEGSRSAGEQELDALSSQGSAPLPVDQRLNVIVFVDHFAGGLADRDRVLRPIEEFLRRDLRAGDRAMIVSHNGLVAVHEPLSNDVDDLLAALDRAVAAGGIEAATEPIGADLSVASIERFVRSLAAVRGRKAILYIGESPDRPPVGDSPLIIEQLTTHADAQRVTVYALGDDELAAADPNRSSTLLSRMRRDRDFYYSLAFEPRRENDGAVHSVTVELRNETARAHHRLGFRDRTMAERMADCTTSALLFEVPENPLGIALDFGDGRRVENNQLEVPVIVKIPMSQVVMQPLETHHEGRLAIYVAERDEHGRTSPVQHFPVPIRIDNDKLLALLAQTGGYSLTLRLSPGEHMVAVAVRDELGHIDSTIRAPWTSGGPVIEAD